MYYQSYWEVSRSLSWVMAGHFLPWYLLMSEWLIIRLTPREGRRCESVCLTFRMGLVTKQNWSPTHPHYGSCGAALMTNSYRADRWSSLGPEPHWMLGRLNDFIIAGWGDKMSVPWNSLFSVSPAFPSSAFLSWLLKWSFKSFHKYNKFESDIVAISISWMLDLGPKQYVPHSWIFLFIIVRPVLMDLFIDYIFMCSPKLAYPKHFFLLFNHSIPLTIPLNQHKTRCVYFM